jgi:hypothetical protein
MRNSRDEKKKCNEQKRKRTMNRRQIIRIVQLALVAVAALTLAGHAEAAGALTPKSSNSKSIIVRVEELHPLTHFAYIPQGSDLSSIKFQGVKKVEVATQIKSTTDMHYCEDQVFRDPGGSMFCPRTRLESPSGAYQVTYSYRGQPLASDEYGNTYFTFSVYFRWDELSPAVRDTLAKHEISRADAAAYFDLTAYRSPVREVVIDETASTFCAGNFVDGSWTHTDSKCEDDIHYTTIIAPSVYVTVKVDPALGRREQAASSIPGDKPTDVSHR